MVRFSRAPQLRQPPEFFFFFFVSPIFRRFHFLRCAVFTLALDLFHFFVVSVRVDAEPKPKERPHYRGVNPVAASPLECLAFIFSEEQDAVHHFVIVL